MGRRHDTEGLSPRALARVAGGVAGGGGGARAGAPPPAAPAPGSPRSEFVPRREDLVADVRRRAGAPGDRVDDAAARAGRHRRVRPPRGAWVRLPSSFVGARWQPGRSGVVGVVAVAVLAVLVLGVRVAWARSAAEPDVVAPGGGARAGPAGISAGAAPVGLGGSAGSSPVAGDPSTPGDGGAGGASTGGVVVVHVVGEVRDPGVRRLPPGSRVSDAVAAAGGATRRADLGAVNLARLVVDGEQVRVPKPGEAIPAAAATGAGPVAGAGSGVPAATVSLNTADQAALETLPGVGPVLAQRILEWRTAHGGFSSVDELTEVSGIGEKTFEQLRPLVTP